MKHLKLLGLILLVSLSVVGCVDSNPKVNGEGSFDESVVITVEDKERVYSEGESYYLVFSEEGEVFKNADELLFGKLNSSDVQGRLKKDHKYQVKVFGIRIPLLSSYRNIIEIEKEIK